MGSGQSLKDRGARGVWVLPGLIALVIAVPGTALWLRGAAEPAPMVDLLLLSGGVIQLESGFDLERTFSGQVMSYQDAGLGFEVGGIVDAVLVVEGEEVKQGQRLARLRQSETLAAVAEQEAVMAETAAALEEAQAQWRLAELVRERRRELARREVLSPEALEMAETDLDSHRARVKAAEASQTRARASLQRLQVRLQQTELGAPHDGVVAAVLARVGQTLEAGAPAIRLVDLDRPHVHLGVPAAVANGLRPGDELTLVSGVERYPARLLALSPTVDAPARTVLAVLWPEVPLVGLRAGELIRVEVVEHRADPGVWLPLSALAEGRRGLWSGYFLRTDAPGSHPLEGDVEPRPLQVVHVRGDHAFVRGPFSDGDIYLSSGLHRAVPGQRVRVTLD
jgi:membrane fusion protein, multidrug efflux system